MSKLDRLKEELGWLKVLFVTLVAIEVSLIAWLVQNVDGASTKLVVFAVVGVLAAGTGIIVVTYAAYKRVVQLENL